MMRHRTTTASCGTKICSLNSHARDLLYEFYKPADWYGFVVASTSCIPGSIAVVLDSYTQLIGTTVRDNRIQGLLIERSTISLRLCS